jgi:hypothetical protein
MAKAAEAEAIGLSGDEVERLRPLLSKHVDVFRVDLGDDTPVKLEPLKVRIKPDSVPVRCGMRRYPPRARGVHARECGNVGSQQDGLPQQPFDVGGCSTHCSKEGSWIAAYDNRQPADQRSNGANAMTNAKPRCCVCDPRWSGGLFHARLDEGLLAARPPSGVSRVLLVYDAIRHLHADARVDGQTDAVAYCMSVVTKLFGDLLFRGLLAWIDDFLGAAKTVDELFDLLDKVLSICAEFGVKLNPNKCKFFLREAEWCGKVVVSSAGIAHSPRRIQGLVDLEPPVTATDLQQFLCATNWMRASIQRYNQLVDPLRKILEVAPKTAAGEENGPCKDFFDSD